MHHQPAQQDGGPGQQHGPCQTDCRPDNSHQQPTHLNLADSQDN
jgi:hypothetical protein